MDEENSKSSDIAITKLRTTFLLKDISGEKENTSEVVYKCLKDNFETLIDEESEDNEPPKSGRYTTFQEPELHKLGSNGEKFYLVHCVVTKTKISNIEDAEQPQDNNSGEIWFLYWGATVKDLKIFCFLRSQNTSAWNILTKYRDFDFPKMFAKAFLDPEGIVKIKTNNLTGIDRGSQTRSYSKDNMFNPSDIIDRFGIVEKMEAPIENGKICSEGLIKFLKIINNVQKNYMTVQQGQIKLPIKTQRKFKPQLENLEMVKLIHDTIHENTDDFINDPRWRFLDHCKLVNSKPFKAKLRNALLKLYNDQNEEVELIHLDSRLSYVHQDSFESNTVKLYFKGTKYEWKSGGDLKGLAIKVRDILDALCAGEVKLTNLEDIDNITLAFYDGANGCEVTEELISMLMSVDLSQDDTGARYTHIKNGCNVYRVTLHSFYEEYYRFVEAVKDCVLYDGDDEDKPDILPWNFENVDFTIEELYDFCSVPSNSENPKKLDMEKLKKILCDKVSLFHEQSSFNNVLRDLENITSSKLPHPRAKIITRNNTKTGPTDKNKQTSIHDLFIKTKSPEKNKNTHDELNNSYINSPTIIPNDNDNNNQSKNKHSGELIVLNRVLIKKSTFQNNFFKKSGTKSKADKKSTDRANDKISNDEGDDNKAKNKAGDKTKKDGAADKNVLSWDDCADKDKAVKEILFEKNPTIYPSEKVKNSYRVKNPHLTKDTWIKLQAEYPEICPVKLVQFLRMKSGVADEGDYNELYHLSNCKCRESGWMYVVGDRILAPTNHKIELFDVMAIKGDKIFYLHVKHDFDASAARNLCSQVKVGIKCLWETLMAYSEESNMIEKFYDVVASKKSSPSVHEKLTKMEVEQIGESKEEFLDVLTDNNKEHYVCLAPFVEGKNNKFKHLVSCNLIDPFSKEDFDGKNAVYETLKKSGVLNEKGRLTPNFFNLQSKKKFEEKIGSYYKGEKKNVEDAYKTIQKKVEGEHPNNSLLSRQTFVSKHEFVDLYNSYSKYKRVHGRKDPIKLKIIDIEGKGISKKRKIGEEEGENGKEKKRKSTEN